ncbi:MAG: primosomal protein N' [Actinomycetaceae bacterium]|nr:primosomal protein N' [Actinomycetaceae bacterium]
MTSNQPSLLGDQLVARVLVDTNLPHLDRLFDYRIPAGMAVQTGSLVRVKMAGRRYNGIVVEVVSESEFGGKLAEIERLVSPIPLVNEAMLTLARDIAKRNAVALAKVVDAMIPDRHAGAEKKFLEQWDGVQQVPTPTEVEQRNDWWRYYAGGPALLERLSKGQSPRAVWQLLPKVYPPRMADHPLLDIVQAVLESTRRVLVIVPTAMDVDRVEAIFQDSPWRVITQKATDTKYRRFKSFLEIQAGMADVVIGTRSAAYAPLPNLGAIVVFDPADDRLDDPQAPYLSALEISVRRAHLERCSLIAAGMSVSIAQAQLVRTGWAAALLPDHEVMRAQTAVVRVPDEFDRDREGAAGHSRIPPSVQSFIRDSLQRGPVLVHVPSRGWVSVIVCDRCGELGRCHHCHGPLRASARGQLTCSWCSRPQVNWRCHNCASTVWRSTRVGSARTAEEFGRALPRVLIETSDAEHQVIDELKRDTGLVIATPGAEPISPSGYAAAVVLDASAILGRPELWAPEEAMRRWMNVLGLVRPDGQMIVVGVRDSSVGQALVRRDPWDYASRLLDEREVLGFFPAKSIVAIDGDRADVEAFTAQMQVPSRCEFLGMAPRVGRDVQKSMGKNPVRAIYRCPWDAAPSLIDSVKATQIERSLKREGLVSVRVNPEQLL